MYFSLCSRRCKLWLFFAAVIYVVFSIVKLKFRESDNDASKPYINEKDASWMAKQLAGDTGGQTVEWSRYKPDKRILYSDVYDEQRTVKTIHLLIVVLSALDRKERRDAIRKTWWTQCKHVNNSIVDCYFFTDTVNGTDDDTALNDSINTEKALHNDLVTMPTTSGLQFGYRFLYMIQWAWSRYDFDYIFRVDDDVMLCVDHVLDNLVHMPLKELHWGWLHCQNGGLVFMDEGVTMFSQDVIQEFLSQDPLRMHCHAYGDQTMTIWIQEIGLNPYELYHPDQERIHHHPPASRVVEFRWMNGICDMYMALHGVYDKDMEDYWGRRGSGKHFNKFERKDVRSMCNHEPFMYWDAFDEPFYAVPKRCIEKHVWSATSGSFRGRENHTAEQDNDQSIH